MMKHFGLVAGLTVSLLLGACGRGGVNAERIVAAEKNGEWLSYGRTYSEQRFSPLDKINATTVGQLGLAWYGQFDTDRGQEATPIMVDGILYATTSWSKVHAYDAKTGKELWSYDPGVDRAKGFQACCDVVNRGVAAWGGNVYVGTLDGRLVALNAKNGHKVWSVQTTDNAKPYTITQAPRVVKGRVLIGNSGAEYGVRGYITAYDARTGAKVWRFYTTPNPTGADDGEASDSALKDHAAPTWPGEGWKLTGGGGTVWDATIYDPDLNLVYFGVGNGTPWSPAARSDGKSDNLFLSSIVAVNADTGAYVWHYQVTPNDSWDFDADQPLMLADLALNGASRRVVMQASKNGFFYVIDAKDGKFISAKPYAAVTWATGIDANGRPVEATGAHYETKAAMNSMPGPYGAHNWHPMAYSPREGLVYIPAMGVPFSYENAPNYKYQAGAWNTAVRGDLNGLAETDAAREATRLYLTGALVAWDPVKQEARWTVKNNYFWNGGVLATGGGLVFQGDAEGVLTAYAAHDGKALWKSPSAGQGIVAAPMTYEIDGEQYLAVLVGAGGSGPTSAAFFLPQTPKLDGRILVFKIGGKATAPAYVVPATESLDLKEITSSGDVGRGALLYANYCLVCHSPNASGQFLPNLRRSPMLINPQDWQGIVYDGKNSSRGMAAFKPFLTPSQVEDVRAYVLSEAMKRP